MRASHIEAFLAALGVDADADTLAAAFAANLASLTTAQLPSEAQAVWRDIAKLAKFAPDRPVPEKTIAALRSWPVQRCAEFIDHVRRLHVILEKRENERLEDEIRDRIRRHYL